MSALHKVWERIEARLLGRVVPYLQRVATPDPGYAILFVNRITNKVSAKKADGTTVNLEDTGSGSGAPTTAEYLVGAADGTLTAERVVTDTTSITWDLATAGQAKAKRAALTGDVTASADSNVTTLAAGKAMVRFTRVQYWAILVHAGSTATIQNIGIAAPATAGPNLAGIYGTYFYYTEYATNIGAGNSCRWRTSTVAGAFRTAQSWTFYLACRTGSDITAIRFWWHLGNPGTPPNTDAGSADHIGIRFSTVAGDTKWTLSKSKAGPTQETAAISASANVAASTEYVLKMRWDAAAGSLSGSVSTDGGATFSAETTISNSTSNPASTTDLDPSWEQYNTDGVAGHAFAASCMEGSGRSEP